MSTHQKSDSHSAMKEDLERRNHAQAGLLNLLLPGAMLRFAYRRDGEKLLLDLEGADGGADSSTLSERLRVALETMRSEGLVFASESVAGGAESEGHTSDAEWVEIQPTSRVFSVKGSRGLGFGVSSKGENTAACEDSAIILPDLPPFPPRRWLDFAAALILKYDFLLAVEIEFTARTLTEAEAEVMTSLYETWVTEAQLLFGATASLNARERFLGLWLLGRKGWEIRCRALVEKESPLAAAVFEMLTCEVFGTARDNDSKEAPSATEMDFRNVYPQGWEFAPLLPSPDYFEEIHALRLLNGRIPKLPETGLLLGMVEGRALRIPHEMRDRHSYIVGATGTGKSTLLFNLIQQDLQAGEGVILLDPHGDLYEQVLSVVPAKRRKQVVTLNPMSDEQPLHINVLDIEEGSRRSWQFKFVIGELLRLFGELWNMDTVGGPMFELYFRNAMLLLGSLGDDFSHKFTLLDFQRVFAERDFRNKLVDACKDEDVKVFWKEIAQKAGGEASLSNIAPYILSKLQVLTQSAFVKQIIGGQDDSLKIADRMNRGKIVLINLSKGVLGSQESRLLGTLLLTQIFAAGLNRCIAPKESRTPVNIYVDEFQNFVSDNMASMLSEARKFGLRLILANQTIGQLESKKGNENLANAVLGNVGHLVLFRLGVPDAERLEGFTKPFSPEDMQMLPNYHAFVRLLTAEGPLKPLVMKINFGA